MSWRPSTEPGRARLVLAIALCAVVAAPARTTRAAGTAAAGEPVGGVASALTPVPAPGPISAAALEAQHGLRVTRVAVTGNGGLVDLRFTVLDPAKARPLLGEGSHNLRLVVEEGGTTLEAPHHGAMRNVRVAKDAACFVLFPNARGAVRPGGRVAVEFGGVRVEAVAAK